MAHQTMIDAITPRLMGVLAQAAALTVISHPGIKGRLREILIRDAISPFLPASVAILTGSIVSLEGSRTHRTQDDLVLFAKETAPLLWESEQAIIPIEGVLAQVEVKSRLTRADVRDALLAASELRSLAVSTAPAGILFAYDSDLTTSEASRLLKVMAEESIVSTSGQSTSPIHMICIGTRGTWLLIEHEGKAGWWFVPTTAGHHMLTFVSLISNFVYKARSGARGVGSYLLDPSWFEGPNPECPLLVA